MQEIWDTERERTGPEEQSTEIWRKYQKGVERHQRAGLYDKTRKAHRFFIGDQWKGLESGGESMPMFNFIQPVVEHKVASVAMNGMSIHYSPMARGADYAQSREACEALSLYAARQWELLKMDKLGWQIIKDACIAGDSYLYFYDRDLRAQVIDNTNIYFADETSGDLQSQPWIIIAERRFVGDVVAEAKKNGIPESQLGLIVPDTDTGQLLGEEARQQAQLEELRCTSLLYLRKTKDGVVSISRSVRGLVYQPDTLLQSTGPDGAPRGRGLTLYPIAGLVWIAAKNSARGVGEVSPLIPNQIEVNKMLTRRLLNAKITAFGRMVYNGDTVTNPDGIGKVGAPIKLRGTPAARVTDHVAYLHPSPMSQDAKNLTEELITQTRDLAGAGDAALGQINPEQASGAAIIAVRDQAALPLNEQIADYKQFCEDVAAIWFDMWVAYHPNGMEVDLGDEGTAAQGSSMAVGMPGMPRMGGGLPDMGAGLPPGLQGMGGMPSQGLPLGLPGGAMPQESGNPVIPAQLLTEMRVNIRIDVSPTSPFSKYAREQALGNLMGAQAITFEEYVEALDDDSTVPKDKLQEILRKRQEQAQQRGMIQSFEGGGGVGKLQQMPLG